MKQREYSEQFDLSFSQLNMMGLHGWELVTVIRVSKQTMLYYFKRPKQDNEKA
jgi:hypothetical protein